VRDLYAEQDLGVFDQGFTATVANYDVAVLKVSHPVTPSKAAIASGRRRRSSSSRWHDCSNSGNRDGSLLPSWWTKAAASLSRLIDGGVDCSDATGCKPLVETHWRPWHDAAAVQLQARIRAAAAAGRQQRLVQGRKKRHVAVQAV
jgi:hypothetical protein